MELTITTQRIAPTNARGTRVRATATVAGEVTVHRLTRAWDYALDTGAVHRAIATALAEMLGHDGALRVVPSRLQTGYRFTNQQKEV